MKNITDEEFRLISQYIKNQSGIYLKPEKKTLMIGRLTSTLQDIGESSFMGLYNRLVADKKGELLSHVIDKITTNHTYFMREKEHFDFFQDQVLPYLKQNVKNKDLRIWCAASSSGEEPYTLAMMLEDYFSDDHWDKKILATDISLDVLAKAKKGVYDSDKITDIPYGWKINYFSHTSEGYEIVSRIKKEVIYRRFNLLEPTYPFKKKFHVIFCRNVMIYFDTETKNRLVDKMYEALEPGGFLFIGHSESIDRSKSNFKYIQPAVYRKV